MRECSSIPKLYDEVGQQCSLDIDSYNSTDNTTCVNWNQYYTNCSAGLINPFKGAINFDNICYAWIAIFQLRSCTWDVLRCSNMKRSKTQKTKQRESQLMKEQRVRFMSNASTLASLSEPGSCYDELLKYLVHIIRKGAKQVAHVCRFLARRAGLNIASSPPASEQQHSQRQRRRRKSSRQGSMSVHQMVHHHHHHHHDHYHLVNGSIREGGSMRCLEGRDVEAGPPKATTGIVSLGLAPPSSLIAASSDSNLAVMGNLTSGATDSSSGCSALRAEASHSTLFPNNPGNFPMAFLAPTPTSRVMKRNSVPFAAPGPKNYPTLQARALAESRRGSVTASTLTNLSFNLNIPPMHLERRPLSLVDTCTPTGKHIMHSST
ncbi:hypothetical protein XENOCAPTIV_026895 [Xenoophorus captivus]|uniref:Uncharacterized protein n=1 Tax=Xenoophorus captivus TaxID=1517983 RepID=A0ABV0SBL9_9TELE